MIVGVYRRVNVNIWIGVYMPKCVVCTYAYDYEPCDIIAIMLRTIITEWNIMLGCDDYTTSHHYILVVEHIVMIRWHEILSDTVLFILPFQSHVPMWYIYIYIYIYISWCETYVICCFIAQTFYVEKERWVTCIKLIYTYICILACHLNSTKPLSEPVLEYYQVSFKKMYLKMLSGKWWPFCLSFNVLTHWCLIMYTIIKRSSLAQVMACCLFVTKQIQNLLWLIANFRNEFQQNLNQYTTI